MKLSEEQKIQLEELEKLIREHIKQHHDGKILASMCVGSHAYGLALPESDLDMRTIHSVPLRKFLSVNPLTPQSHSATIEFNRYKEKELDIQSVEVGKFCSLCLKCNPSVLEMLFMPDDMIISRSDIYNKIKENRRKFIGKKQLVNAYVGYSTSQLQRFSRTALDEQGLDRVKFDLFKPQTISDVIANSKDTWNFDYKNASHTVRLLLALKHVLVSSELMIDVGDDREGLLNIKKGVNSFHDVLKIILLLCENIRQLETDSSLPEEIDSDFVDEILYDFRIKEVKL